MKTVHGAEFYANKKHKGGGDGGGSDEAGAGGHSPSRSEDLHPKTPSMSSPSVKSESEANSPPSMMQQQGSPLIGGCNDDMAGVGGVAGDGVVLAEEHWNEEPDDLDIADLPVALRAMVSCRIQKFIELIKKASFKSQKSDQDLTAVVFFFLIKKISYVYEVFDN